MTNSNQEKLIKDAQYRKGLSIAFFNSVNSAIALVAGRQIADRDEALKESDSLTMSKKQSRN